MKTTCTYGRKLQDELGRLDTRVKISDIRRCCTLVSCNTIVRTPVSHSSEEPYKLGVEFGEARLAGVIENKHSVYHSDSSLAHADIRS